MWVMAICTRRNGRRVPKEEQEEMAPARGRLWVTTMRAWADDGERRPLTASLLGERGSERQVFRQLDKVRVKVRDGQVMVLGYEDHGSHPKNPKPVPQVWWCDPIRDPVDEVEARAKARFPPNIGAAKRAATLAAVDGGHGRLGLHTAAEVARDAQDG